MTASLQRRTFTGTVAVIGLGAVLAAAAPFAAAQILPDLRKKGELTVGVLVDFPPYGTTNAHQPDGYDADVARLLAKELSLKLNLVPVNGELSKLYRKWLERDLPLGMTFDRGNWHWVELRNGAASAKIRS